MRTIASLLLAGLVLGAAGAARAQYKPPTYLAEPGSLTDRYLTPGEARDVLHGATSAFEACFLEQGGIAGGGDVTLRLTVNSDGRPEGIEVEAGEGQGSLQGCLEQVAGGLSFPAHDGDPLALAYPLVFVRDDRGSRLVPYPIVFVKPRERAFLLLPMPLTLTLEEREALERLLYP